MGALGPTGYPGPKGLKVNKSHPSIRVSSQPGTPLTHFSPEGSVPGHGVGGGEEGGPDGVEAAGQELSASQT